MALPSGSRLGPYEILGQIGAGGMGEVYRARDLRLGREVAIKVLPSDLSADADRLRRFEKEARAASALSHPNIVTIHELVESGPGLCIVMELVSGRTVREMLAEGAFPTRKWLAIATQTAEGLAKAHAAGIVHRDLKPENLMITDDGIVKILDFGLAKLTQPEEASGATQAPTVSGATEPGLVMGTVGYMSPEQARGQKLDFRSDQFSFGSVLYELATGRRAFALASTPETLSAIIREEPQPIGELVPGTPAPVRWIVDRCLAKEPRHRYASTEDLARDLASVRDHLSELSGALPAAATPRRSRVGLVLAALGALAVTAAAGVLLGGRLAVKPPPSFTPVTYRRGLIRSARFAPDGGTIVYSGAWDGKNARLFLKRLDSPEETPVPFASDEILSISKSGEMAIALGCVGTHTGVCSGALARAPMTGGAPRLLLDNVQQADWAPDGETLAVSRDVGGRGRLEFPIGKVLYETPGHTSFPRISPGGDLVAFIDNPIQIDNRGSVAVLDRSGRKRTLGREWAAIEGLAWSPRGDEVWFTAAEAGGNFALRAVNLGGVERLLARVPGSVRIHDVSRTGRLLITEDTTRVSILGRAPGESREHDLSWLDWSIAADISRDGKTLLLAEEGEVMGEGYAVCVRGMDGSPVIRLGEGSALSLSPDGKWALTQLTGHDYPLALLPTGSGERRMLPTGGIQAQDARWLDERRIVVAGAARGRRVRLYVQDVSGGEPRPISPEGIEASYTSRIAPSPDGRFVASFGPDHECRLYPTDGGESRPVPSVKGGETVEGWSQDGRSLYVRGVKSADPPARLFRVDVESGRREPWKELMPADPAGLEVIGNMALAMDGEAYAYSPLTKISRLFVADGIR